MPLPSGFDGPRLIRKSEMRDAFLLDSLCFGGDPNAEWDGQDASGQTYVITHQGKLVSAISTFLTWLRFYDGYVMVGSIGGVCTHPEYRNQQLATHLLKYCAGQLAANGAKLLLISGARGIYTRAGCVLAGRYASFKFSPGSLPESAEKISLRRAEPADATFCSRLYQGEPVHFERRWPVFADQFAHPEESWTESWIVEMNGQPAAYFVLMNEWGHSPDEGIRYLHEYAGSKIALTGGLAQVMADCHFQELGAEIPWQDSDLIHMLSKSGMEPSWTPLGDHTFRVLDFPGLMQGMLTNLQARLDPALLAGLRFEQTRETLLEGEGEGGYIITLGDERLELDGLAATRLIFSGVDAVPEAKKLGDQPESSRLAQLLSQFFPLPSFLPGLDYH